MKLFWKIIVHNDVTGCVIFISNKIEYLKKVGQLKKFYHRSYIMILTDLSNTINKLWEKISFHKLFKWDQDVDILRHHLEFHGHRPYLCQGGHARVNLVDFWLPVKLLETLQV